jgi:hypothetical protein
VRRAALIVLLVCVATPAHAKMWKQRPEFNLVIGRFPRHVPEYTPTTVETPPRGVEDVSRALTTGAPLPGARDEQLAALDWLARHDFRDRPEAYVALGRLWDAGGDAWLAWWAFQRALELHSAEADALGARCAAIEAAWRAAGRKDAPTAEQFAYERQSADRWVAAFQNAEREAIAQTEDPMTPSVLSRLTQEADLEVPEVVLGADSFMRRWGMALLIGGIGSAFGLLYAIAVLRRRRAGASAATAPSNRTP